MQRERVLGVLFILWGMMSAGCALVDDMAPAKQETSGLIATPPSYYSTPKARYLAARYKDNLDRLVERITRNPKTSSLQFANNISSVGGIGFFTHSATKTPDERYLEVVLATPETFEIKGGFSDKVQQVIGRYGVELLGIVSGDSDIFQDREMSGYGLNLAWRNVVKQTAGNRVTLERAIIYFSKESVRGHLRQGANPNELLADAVIFAVEEDGPLKLVSYSPKQPQPDIRPVIQEDNLASVTPPPAGFEPAVKSPGAEKSAQPDKVDPASATPSGAAPPASRSETKAANLPAPVKLPPAPAAHIEGSQPIVAERAGVEAKSQEALASIPPAARAPVSPVEPEPQKSTAPLVALKSRSDEANQDAPTAARLAAKPLEGFIVQLAFNDKEKAQRWAESMVKRGFAVSLTEAGSEGALRVRLGNFAAREDAERQLRQLKQDGVNGIIISLPQAFRPLARSSMP